MKKHPALYIAQAAVIAAMYAALTILQNILLPGSASMAIQFRVAEVLAILAVYTHAAIPGLTVGCMVANISSLFALGPYDLIFGALASFFAALFMYALRNVRIFKLPVLAALIHNSSPLSLLCLIRFAAMLIGGSLGGILGVKEKTKIKI